MATQRLASDHVQGFPPLLSPHPRVLILGSAPSVASLEKQQYYGKPQNAFWKIMGELFGAGPDVAYDERVSILGGQGIAVWDVLASCTRPGSLDSAIDMSTAEINPLGALLERETTITHVFFNGRKAAELFRKKVLPDLYRGELVFECLPSTSPAMATLNFAGKLERWRIIERAVRA